MDWVDRLKNCKGLYGILQLLQGSHLDNFSLKTLKLDWVAFHSATFQLRCLDFQSTQYKKNSSYSSHVSAMGYVDPQLNPFDKIINRPSRNIKLADRVEFSVKS